jgi:TonB family protein
MTLLDTAINATLLMSLGLGILFLLRPMTPALKHTVCAVTLALVVFLPAIGALPFDRPPALVNVAIEARSMPLDGDLSAQWLPMLWLCGAGFVVIRFAAGVAYLEWLTRRASLRAGRVARDRIETRYADVSTPLVWGWLHPTILLPRSFRDWSSSAQQAALDHELAHVYRWDSWISLVVTAAQAMYWFHPLVWVLSTKLLKQREMAADDCVLSLGADPALYARTLLELEQGRRSRFLFECGMRSGSLRERVEHVLRDRRVSRKIPMRVALFCGIGLLVVSALAVPARAHLSEDIYKIGGDVSAPKLVRKVEPDYTRKSRREKTQGTVLLAVVINKNGKPRAVRVERSLTPDLDRQAVRAVSSWRFKPAMRAGRPVSVQAQVEVNFRLL